MPKITLSQGTIHYEDSGRGAPVVFVHGLLVNGLLWRKVVPSLSKNVRCIVPDWPLGSHEIPMNEDADLSVEGVAKLVADFIEALDLRDVTLVGNDSGGAISQLVAARHPERLGRLVLTTCDAYEVFPPALFSYLSWLPRIPGLTRGLAQAMLRVPPLRRLPLAYGLLAKSRIPDDVLTRYIKPSATIPGVRRDVAKFTGTISNKITLAVAGELRSFNKPVLILWTPEDRFFPIALAERLASDLPNAELVRIEDAHVFVAEDQPERVASEISRFVAAENVLSPQVGPN